MAKSDDAAEEAQKKKSRLPVVLGLVVMLALGGGFYATYAGLVFGPADKHAAEASPQVEALPDIAFVPIEPLVISLGAEPRRYLHFSAEIEVAKPFEADIVLILPRIVDVLNGYLRAVEVSDLEDPTALVRLRAQMLRRVQMVAGEGRVRDLLVTGFVIN